MKHALQRIHFVGIGGVGMSGIALVLRAQGYEVSGSDSSESASTRALAQAGVRIAIGHAAAHLGAAQAVVASSAIATDNPEIQAAQAAGLPVLPRAVMLAELMRGKTGIAIAGTHGKTTTTSLVTSVLRSAGLDPSFVIGGTLRSAGSNAHHGGGEHIVVEADESDASFLHLPPLLAAVTNIDADHMATYGHSEERLRQAFIDFLHRLPFYGTAVVCSDDAGVCAILPQLRCRVLSTGLNERAAVRAVNVQAVAGGQMRFDCLRQGRPPLPLTLNLAGEHNVRNALLAVAMAQLLGVADTALVEALNGFPGVGRRFEHHGRLAAQNGGHFDLLDDYGHHPVELAAVLAAARGAYPGRRLVLAFEPHRYSRTRDCLPEFAQVLAQADVLLLAPVYAAGEAPIAGADSPALLAAVAAVAATGRMHPQGVAHIAQMPQALASVARNGDVLLTMGAGSIAQVPAQLKVLLQTPNGTVNPQEKAA